MEVPQWDVSNEFHYSEAFRMSTTTSFPEEIRKIITFLVENAPYLELWERFGVGAGGGIIAELSPYT